MVDKEVIRSLETMSLRADIGSEEKAAISEAVTVLKQKPTDYDLWIYRWVVVVLGLIALITVIGGLMISVLIANASLPDAIVALGSAAVGALAGLLAPSPKS